MTRRRRFRDAAKSYLPLQSRPIYSSIGLVLPPYFIAVATRCVQIKIHCAGQKGKLKLLFLSVIMNYTHSVISQYNAGSNLIQGFMVLGLMGFYSFMVSGIQGFS